jgi:hypothetical protein
LGNSGGFGKLPGYLDAITPKQPELLRRSIDLGMAVIPAHGVLLDYPEPGLVACSCDNPGCNDVGKHPRIAWSCISERGKVPTLDNVRCWISTLSRSHPGPFNWAYHLGMSNLAVIDIDPRNGGLESWAELTARYGATPPTPRDSVRTRGWHEWYVAPAGALPAKAKVELAPGIDFKAGEGYVIGPPSTHRCGHPYVWEPAPWDVPFAPLPQ